MNSRVINDSAMRCDFPPDGRGRILLVLEMGF